MSLVGIQFKFPNWKQKLLEKEDELNRFVAAQMQTNRGALFDAEGNYNGHEPWAPLRLRDGQILAKRGNLRKSLAPLAAVGSPGPGGVVRFAGDVITIGTTLLYARMMNDGTKNLPGGVLRPKNAQALKIPLPSGKSNLLQNRRKQLYEERVDAESDKRAASLDKRIEKVEKLLGEAKTNASRAKRKAYLDKLLMSRSISEEERLSRYKKAASDRGQFIFRKSVKIPPRPFDNWTREDQEELTIAFRNKIVEILNGG